MQRENLGFALIELMIVIAILAILVSLALPAYQDFSIRAKVSEGLHLAGPAQLAVAEAVNSELPPTPTNTGFTGAQSDYVDSIVLANDGSGVITVTTKNTGANPDVAFALAPIIDPNGQVTWNCNWSTGDPRYLPASCRTP